ncbi:anthranilate synthase component I family protein, partial [Candidatus Micrarchaeota archaeon]|nr:anthranilate synthase component I family protein [Candidatus Micrarchaeota archaeon]
YDLVRFFEKLPSTLPDNLKIPDIYFVIHRNAIIFDHNSNKIHFVTHLLKDEVSDLKKLVDTVNTGPELRLDTKIDYTKVESNTSKEKFIEIVEKAREYIRIGDIFQVVLSRRVDVTTKRDPIAIYFDLRKINPSPYMFYLDYGDFQVLGASPEIQVRVENDKIEMRPIAGTRGRGSTDKEELSIERELLGDDKERAEHTMLVDLCRNDLGRISEFGSVKEPELFIVERYSHVQHIVSHVVGKLKKGFDSFDVFRATFPAGTVSGAPKVRAMEIIEELEKESRGTYAGIVGYFDLKGSMDTCITIRSILVKDGKASVQAGAGIVLDSNPNNEWIETKRKANACIKAITGKELDL